MIKKLKKHFLFFIFLVCNLTLDAFPAFTMGNDEDLKREASMSSAFQLISFQQKGSISEDAIKLETYLTNLQNYKIGVKKDFFPEEKKVELIFKPTGWFSSFLDINYGPVFTTFPLLEGLLVSLDFSHKVLTLMELERATTLAKNNTNIVEFKFHALEYQLPCKEKEPFRRLLKAVISRNALMGGVIKDFNYNFFLSNAEEDIITEGLQYGKDIRTSNVGFNGERGNRIIDSIKESKTINSIKFSFYDRNLSLDELNSLELFMINSPSLTSLDLTTHFDAPLLISLSNVLKQNPLSLERLNLRLAKEVGPDRQIAEEAAAIFFKSLQGNKSLRVLCFELPLSLENTQALADVLKINTTLEVLAINGQGIGDKGIAYLTEGLRENKSLKEINIAANNISDYGGGVIIDLLNINKTLTTFHLGGNPISDPKKLEIRKMLDKRKVPVFPFNREISLP